MEDDNFYRHFKGFLVFPLFHHSIIPSPLMWKLAAIVFILGIMALTGCGGGEVELPEGGVVKLRSRHKVLSEVDVKSILERYGFYDKRWNRSGGFPNRFKLKTLYEKKTIMDLATNLTWHQSGSEFPLTFKDAEEWMKNLNMKGYAGHSDWRLPTLEEALSLLERKAVKRYHIDPLFSTEQYSMWTGDYYYYKYSDKDTKEEDEVWKVWGVSFNFGRVFKVHLSESDYVRPVRTGTDDT